jgi:hypothetical protein
MLLSTINYFLNIVEHVTIHKSFFHICSGFHNVQESLRLKPGFHKITTILRIAKFIATQLLRYLEVSYLVTHAICIAKVAGDRSIVFCTFLTLRLM